MSIGQVMTAKDSKIPYRCTFCRTRLKPADLGWADYLKVLFLLKPYQCPHCFEVVTRPIAFLGRLIPTRLPFLSRDDDERREKKGARGYTSQGGILKRSMANVARAANALEDAVSWLLSATFGLIRNVILFIPKRLMSLRKSRDRDRKFLKSDR